MVGHAWRVFHAAMESLHVIDRQVRDLAFSELWPEVFLDQTTGFMDGFWLAFDLDMVGDESVEKVGNCVTAPFGCSISGWILAIGHPAQDFLGLLPCGLGCQRAVSADGPPSLLVAGISINHDEGLDAG